MNGSPCLRVPKGMDPEKVAVMTIEVINLKVSYCRSRKSKNILRKACQILLSDDDVIWGARNYRTTASQTVFFLGTYDDFVEQTCGTPTGKVSKLIQTIERGLVRPGSPTEPIMVDRAVQTKRKISWSKSVQTINPILINASAQTVRRISHRRASSGNSCSHMGRSPVSVSPVRKHMGTVQMQESTHVQPLSTVSNLVGNARTLTLNKIERAKSSDIPKPFEDSVSTISNLEGDARTLTTNKDESVKSSDTAKPLKDSAHLLTSLYQCKGSSLADVCDLQTPTSPNDLTQSHVIQSVSVSSSIDDHSGTTSDDSYSQMLKKIDTPLYKVCRSYGRRVDDRDARNSRVSVPTDSMEASPTDPRQRFCTQERKMSASLLPTGGEISIVLDPERLLNLGKRTTKNRTTSEDFLSSNASSHSKDPDDHKTFQDPCMTNASSGTITLLTESTIDSNVEIQHGVSEKFDQNERRRESSTNPLNRFEASAVALCSIRIKAVMSVENIDKISDDLGNAKVGRIKVYAKSNNGEDTTYRDQINITKSAASSDVLITMNQSMNGDVLSSRCQSKAVKHAIDVSVNNDDVVGSSRQSKITKCATPPDILTTEPINCAIENENLVQNVAEDIALSGVSTTESGVSSSYHQSTIKPLDVSRIERFSNSDNVLKATENVPAAEVSTMNQMIGDISNTVDVLNSTKSTGSPLSGVPIRNLMVGDVLNSNSVSDIANNIVPSESPTSDPGIGEISNATNVSNIANNAVRPTSDSAIGDISNSTSVSKSTSDATPSGVLMTTDTEVSCENRAQSELEKRLNKKRPTIIPLDRANAGFHVDPRILKFLRENESLVRKKLSEMPEAKRMCFMGKTEIEDEERVLPKRKGPRSPPPLPQHETWQDLEDEVSLSLAIENRESNENHNSQRIPSNDFS